MSGVTVPLGFPYPTDGDLVQEVDEAIQSLAEAVDDMLVGSAAGWQNAALGAGVAAIATGTWGVPGSRLLAGGLVVGRGLVSGPAIAVGALVCTLAVGHRPLTSVRKATQIASSGGGVQAGIVTVAPDGTVRIESTATAGNNLALSLAFDFTTL